MNRKSYLVNTAAILLVALAFTACNSTRDKPKPAVKTTANELVKAEGKNEMILLTDRPFNLETPLHYFLYDFTPNEVFFVRWHLANMPSHVGLDTFRLRVGGHVNKSLSLSLEDLKTKFKPVSVNALAACAGNARSFFDPRVPGGQWKNGAMGNARWTGVKLKDVLDMAGIKPHAREVSFNGMDEPPLPSVPDFIKSLKIEHAMDGEVMIAYEMNGAPLPMLNGYPLKLIVPGWYATYWVGMLNEIKVYADTFKGFWMDKAYLVPKDIPNGNEKPDSLAKQLAPINRMDVRSIFVSPEPESVVHLAEPCTIQGLAFDGGYGITKVEVSPDSGVTWSQASLEMDMGKYSWRRWKYIWNPTATGTFTFVVKATNAKGETQPWHQWNRSGYMRNEIESLKIKVAERND
jgi:sulfite dehydrogenase (cytochrome) subunit A